MALRLPEQGIALVRTNWRLWILGTSTHRHLDRRTFYVTADLAGMVYAMPGMQTVINKFECCSGLASLQQQRWLLGAISVTACRTPSSPSGYNRPRPSKTARTKPACIWPSQRSVTPVQHFACGCRPGHDRVLNRCVEEAGIAYPRNDGHERRTRRL